MILTEDTNSKVTKQGYNEENTAEDVRATPEKTKHESHDFTFLVLKERRRKNHNENETDGFTCSGSAL